jgi:hypothetical protein
MAKAKKAKQGTYLSFMKNPSEKNIKALAYPHPRGPNSVP